jgi:hypothetical protein
MKGIAVNPSIDDAKTMARRLRAALEARGLAASHSDALELVATQLGFRDWNTASAALKLTHDAATFDDAREVGAQLPNVKVTTDRLGIALKLGTEILACTAIHKSAEPNSLMVRLGFERRHALVAEDPNAFYLTAHYEPYPVVLVRLTHVSRSYLGALLMEAWQFDRGENK